MSEHEIIVQILRTMFIDDYEIVVQIFVDLYFCNEIVELAWFPGYVIEKVIINWAYFNPESINGKT